MRFLMESEHKPSIEPLYGAFFFYRTGALHTQVASAWRARLSDLGAVRFPSLSNGTLTPNPDSRTEYILEDICFTGDTANITAILWAAWAFLAASYTDSNDVIFGYQILRQNRKAPTVVPVRMLVDDDTSVADLLKTTLALYEEIADVRSISRHWIRQLGENEDRACAFQTLLQVEETGNRTGALDSCRDYALLLRCQVEEHRVHLTVQFDSSIIKNKQIQRMAAQFGSWTRRLTRVQADLTSVREIRSISDEDLSTVWSWNANVPDTADTCVHDLISDIATRHPNLPAICAWDGELTYRELDILSTKVAFYLVCQGVRPGTIIPLCFEKSMWTPVAMMAIMKAGAASATMDPSDPEARLRTVVQQAFLHSKKHFILSSQTNVELSRRLSQKGDSFESPEEEQAIIVIPETIVKEIIQEPILPPIMVQPDDLLYVAFTSGSTGLPKGVMVTHRNFSSAIRHRQEAFGFHGQPRVFDSASYAFNAVWFNLLHTLGCGGCLCIPSEADRKGDIAGAMRRFAVTYTVMIPTLARIISYKDVPSLQSITFAGEKLHEADILQWSDIPSIRNGYGSAECTVASCVGPITPGQKGDPSIGRGRGSIPWVVRKDGDALASIGEVGELWFEGPLVTKGYLSNAEKTAEAFIQDPLWLLRGGPDCPGRKGRLYRSGDLGRYNPDGTLQFMGRKDDQVKIRGQRVELGDIEHHLRQCLPSHTDISVVAEVAQPSNSPTPLLIAFLALGDVANGPSAEVATKLGTLVPAISDKITQYLVSYMVPTAYIPLAEIPLTPTGKTNRRHLREIIASMTLEEIAAWNPTRSQRMAYQKPATDSEHLLQRLWAVVLDIDQETISINDSFFQIGGDSVSAMRLVAAARDNGLSFSVADVFRCPRLVDLASALSNGVDQVESINPFSLLGSKAVRQDVCTQAAARCGIHDHNQVVDVFPCTQLQQGLLAMTTKSSGKYVIRKVFQLPSNVDLPRFRRAWHQVVTAHDILRTRIVDLPDYGLVQVVSPDGPLLDEHDDLSAYLTEDHHRDIGLGSPLTYASLIDEKGTNYRYFVWTVHHALYDGWSLPMLLEDLTCAYNEAKRPAAVSFQAFVKYTSTIDLEAASNYWKAQFAGCEAPVFPSLPTPTFQPRADETLCHVIQDFSWPRTNITPSNIIRTAWAILQARHSDSSDVVFGAVVSGRQASMPGIDCIVGPTIATVPVRIRVDPDARVHDLQSRIQQQSAEMLPYEQFGLSRINSLSEMGPAASNFQSVLIVQPKEDLQADGENGSTLLTEVQTGSSDALHEFNTNALTVICDLHDQGIDFILSFDSNVLPKALAKRMAEQFEVIILQLCMAEASETMIAEITAATTQDLTDIWSWNSTVPESFKTCIHDRFAAVVQRQPAAPAICAWDGDLTYHDLDVLSTNLACYLVSQGIGSGSIVPLCFEKSKWTPVAILGVMKAGAASLALDTSYPVVYLQGIVKQVHAHSKQSLILSSRMNEELSYKLVQSTSCKAMVVVMETVVQQATQRDLPKVHPEDLLYVVFTSGSTGTPKGVMITHENFCNAIGYHQRDLGYIKSSRVFDFASYAFDLAWGNVLHTLTAGGCLCTPSDDDRRNNIPGSFEAMQSSLALLTPTIWALFSEDQLSRIETAIAGGEALSQLQLNHLSEARRALNAYGPAECTVFSTFIDIKQQEIKEPSIGRGQGLVTWVVRRNGVRLAAIGEVGELWLEGPLVGKGYLGNPQKTAESFIEDPPWLIRGGPSISGRRGRLYRTGDLVRYNAQGTLIFVGRKDDQVKIRGQRVELGDVEHHLRQCLAFSQSEVHIAAEIARPSDSNAPLLIAFLALGDMVDQSRDETTLVLGRLIAFINRDIRKSLMAHMIPTAYIPIKEIPLTKTGKTDRRRLRNMVAGLTLGEIADWNPARSKDSYEEPATEIERQLQQLWSSILSVDPISAHDNFFQIGGDSISAMRLVAAARDQGLSISVADIFEHPSLRALASQAAPYTVATCTSAPFSLVDVSLDRLYPLLRAHHPSIRITNVLPTTDFQQQCIRSATSTLHGQTYHFFVDFPLGIHAKQLLSACHRLWDKFDILRMIFVRNDNHKCIQAVAQDIPLDINLHSVECPIEAAQQWCATDNHLLQLGKSYVRMAIFHSPEKPVRLAMRLCHAQYDGIMLHKLFGSLEADLNGSPSPIVVPFSEFLQSIAEKRQASTSYWRQLLQGSVLSRLPYDAEDPSNIESISHKITVKAPQSSVTAATTFVALCSTAISHMIRSKDLTIGFLVSGRATAPHHMDVGGPCVNVIPIRVNFQECDSLEQVTASIQKQRATSLTYEASQLSDIMREATTWTPPENFGFILQFQNIEEQPELSVAGSRSKFGVYQEHAIHDMPSISIVARPMGDKWEVTYTASAKFYQQSTILRLAGELQKMFQ